MDLYEMLWKMYKEGKITLEQYYALTSTSNEVPLLKEDDEVGDR